MIKPAYLQKSDQPAVIGSLFGSPVVVKGWTGLPLFELGAWSLLTWVAAKIHPEWSPRRHLSAGALTTAIIFGFEWGHDLTHAAFAWHVGKPADAIRIFFGNPLLVYYDVNDRQVTPLQHMTRASGGPVFNALMVPFAWLARKLTKKGSFPRYLADFALGTNVLLSSLILLPIPMIDGGPILKWSVVRHGRTPAEADNVVKKVNLAVGGVMAAASAVALENHRKRLGAAAAVISLASLAIGLGLLKEQ